MVGGKSKIRREKMNQRITLWQKPYASLTGDGTFASLIYGL